jgi:dTDP-4-amino-4,6-dideoxygalactose transaminase
VNTSREQIQFLALNREFELHRDEYLEAMTRCLETGQVVGGSETEALESEIARVTNRKHAITVSSGTDALLVASAALELDNDWDVLVPAYSFIATASSMRHRSTRLHFVDVDEHYHLDPRLVEERKADDRKLLMVPVGLYGNPLDHRLILTHAERLGAVILEDAAQSLGSCLDGHVGGSLGTISTISFAPTKTVPAFGNLGAITTDDDELARRCRNIRQHGKNAAHLPAEQLGYNAMPSSILVSQLRVTFRHLETRQARRDEIAAAYLDIISRNPVIKPPPLREHGQHNWHKFVIRTSARDRAKQHFADLGIQTQIHYPLPLNNETNLATDHEQQAPCAAHFSRTSLTLPLYPSLTDSEVERICDAIASFRGA